jgi:aspartate kinase
MLVMKFGGTSVGGAERIRTVASIVKSFSNRKPVVVVSAVTKVTDALIALAEECAKGKDDTLQRIIHTHYTIMDELKLEHSIIGKDLEELYQLVKQTKKSRTLNAKTLDHFQSFGERMSSKIVASHMASIGMKAEAFNAWDLGMRTNENFGDAEPLETSYKALRKNITKRKAIPVITGFLGKTRKNDITTLGRGGSDYTAAIIGAAISAETIQIWTDVNGIMTTDPRIVPSARTIPELAFEEACELAYFGAKVLHPKTILPAMKKNIPVQVLNTFEPRNRGTTIVSTFEARKKSAAAVEAFSYKKNITAIHINSPAFFDGSGLMSRIFSIFERHNKSVDVVSTSVVSVSLTVDSDGKVDGIVKELEKLGSVEVITNKAIVCAVGGRTHAASVAATIFSVLGTHSIPVEMISQASSGISITFVVDNKDAQEAISLLHKEFFR